MEYRIFTEPQRGASYGQQRAVALEAERLGFDAFFRSDHYLSSGTGSGLPGPTDSWATLAALAVETSRIRLGTLVTAATFRYPGPLAIAVAQVDEMSGGRVELGLGAGWFAEEHAAYGIPFPPLAERFERLEEQLQIVLGLWTTPPGERFSFSGRHYSLEESPALPKPSQSPHPPIITGGAGAVRTPRLAARYADEFNVPLHSIGETAAQFERVRDACDAVGRSPQSMVFSAAQTVCVGETEAELHRRAERIGSDLERLRANGLAGRPDEVISKLNGFAEAGARRIYLQLLDLDDLDQLRLIAERVVQAHR